MPDYPPAVLAAAESAIIEAATDFGHDDIVCGSSRQFARATLDAAAPLLAEAWGAFECEPLRTEDAPEAAPAPRYPQHAACAACGRLVLVTMGRDIPLMFDPEPDGEGDHFDAVLTADLSRVSGSGDATAIDCKGRFPLYRAHAWTCPRRLEAPDGQWGIWVPRHVEEEP